MTWRVWFEVPGLTSKARVQTLDSTDLLLAYLDRELLRLSDACWEHGESLQFVSPDKAQRALQIADDLMAEVHNIETLRRVLSAPNTTPEMHQTARAALSETLSAFMDGIVVSGLGNGLRLHVAPA